MQRLLAAAQKVTGVKYDINSLSDVYEAIHVIQGELGITGATALEASETLQGSFSAMKASATDLLGALSTGTDITPQLEVLAQTASTWFFGNMLPMVTNMVANVPTLIAGVLQTGLPLLVDQGLQMIKSLSSGISMNLPTLAISALGMIASLSRGLSENVGEIIASGIKLLKGLIQGLKNAIPALVYYVPEIIHNIVTTIIENLPEIISSGIELMGSLIEGISQMLPDIVQAMLDICGELLRIVTEIDWLKLGKDIVDGIISGISSMGSALWESLKEVASNALRSVKNFLGIGSPSKVFRDQIGQWIPEGVAVGVEANTKSLTDAMKEMAYDAAAVPITQTITRDSARDLGSIANQTINAGGNTFNIYADKYNNDPLEIAEVISDVLARGIRREEAVFE